MSPSVCPRTSGRPAPPGATPNVWVRVCVGACLQFCGHTGTGAVTASHGGRTCSLGGTLTSAAAKRIVPMLRRTRQNLGDGSVHLCAPPFQRVLPFPFPTDLILPHPSGLGRNVTSLGRPSQTSRTPGQAPNGAFPAHHVSPFRHSPSCSQGTFWRGRRSALTPSLHGGGGRGHLVHRSVPGARHGMAVSRCSWSHCLG